MHLERTLERTRVLAEHGEDELGAVEHVGVDGVEHGRHLRRRKIVLTDGHRGLLLGHDRRELAHLALAEVRACAGHVAALDDVGHPLHVGRAEEFFNLVERLVLPGVVTASGNDGEHHASRARGRGVDAGGRGHHGTRHAEDHG